MLALLYIIIIIIITIVIIIIIIIIIHVKRGVQQEANDSIKLEESFVVQSLKQQSHYKFLGVLENIKQEDLLALECASKEYLKRLCVILSSPLSLMSTKSLHRTSMPSRC